MGESFILLCGLFALTCCAQATYHHSSLRCECNGRSRYCLRDAWGLRCVDCEGNTEGRHCERCRAGFYRQNIHGTCSPCRCHDTGAVSSKCDSRGRCNCKEGFSGVKCDLCADGQVIGPDGCTRSRQLREDSGSWRPSCFCFGHSSECSPQLNFYIHNITSTFSDGLDGWRAATVDGHKPRDVFFRWSPTHKDIEVISSNNLPVYLYAPDRFLGDKLHSYGQNLSFSLRLDRGVGRPSVTDVILEGAGLRVSTSLGELRHSVPCGQKRFYSFRLDESQWSPEVSSFTFQKLLQNLTSIKIRATFGHGGRGYLDNVSLVTARPGVGTEPAGWVTGCQCPPGLEGAQCELCAPGHKRSDPSRGAFSGCEPCQCPQGSCDSSTGECLSSDANSQDCPHGYSGPNCAECSVGFYRETVRGDGFPAPCQPCSCDKHGSVSGQCDSSGTCRCKAGFEGQKCDQSKCPLCFNPVTAKLEQFAVRLRELEQHFSGPVQTEDLEAALKNVQRQLDNLQDEQQYATDAERRQQKRLSTLGSEQLILGQEVEDGSRACREARSSKQTYTEQVDDTEDLIRDMRRLLEQAQRRLRAAELPQADSPSVSNPFAPLLQKALDLLQLHRSDADSTEAQAEEALKDSEKSAALAQPLVDREKQVHKKTQDLQDMLQRISTEVKDLEALAPQVSSGAKDQSKTAARLLQDILKSERGLPTPLKAEAEDMLSRLNQLQTTADLADLEKVKAAVKAEQAGALDLLTKGKSAQKTFDKLVTRVDKAKSDTEDALKRIGRNSEDLDDALGTLKGFDDQMDQAEALAKAAINILPFINSTVQSANNDNAAARGLVGGVRQQLEQATDTHNQLKDALDKLQDSWTSVPPTEGLLDQASLLRHQAEKLLPDSSSAAAQVQKELPLVADLLQQATQGAKDADSALDKVQMTRDAVRKTLRDISSMINSLNGSEPVDIPRLEKLEGYLGNIQKDVSLDLGPRLDQLLQKEQAHRDYLSTLDDEVSTILKDIQNIEEILRAVPPGCYNNPPLEEA